MKPSPRGPSLDLTSGPILATLVVFAAPTLLGNVLQTLNGTINAIWVGRMLGESALAATANANIIMFLVFSAVFGFSMAATVRIINRSGVVASPDPRKPMLATVTNAIAGTERKITRR